MTGPARTLAFISFRTDDQGAYAAAVLDDALGRVYGRDAVFRSARSIPAGAAFPAELRSALDRACVTLVLIGPNWLTAADEHGIPRLTTVDDWVRREVAVSLDAGIPVIPVILSGGRRPEPGELPVDLAGLAERQAVTLRHRHLGADLPDLVRHLDLVAPALAQGRLLGRRPVPGPDLLPSSLLRPEFELVPFAGRAAELATLHRWLDQPDEVSMRLITGPGGRGKSRLALQLCRRAGAAGWIAGPLTADTSIEDISGVAELGLPTLVVIDQAEAQTARTLTLLGAFCRRPVPASPARLLLVARSEGMWQRDLTDHPGEREAAVVGRMGLLPLDTATRPDDPFGEYVRAMTAFARHLGRPVPPDHTIPTGWLARSAGSYLDIHSAALQALLGPSAAEPGPAVERLLHHERAYWRSTAQAWELPDPYRERLDAVVAAVTLIGPAGPADTTRVLRGLPTFDGERRHVVDRYVTWVRRLYPDVLRPDTLGEQHVATAVTGQPSLVSAVAAVATPEQATHGLAVLSRAAPRHPALVTAMAELLAVDPRRFVPAGIEAVRQVAGGEALVGVLAATVADSGDVTVAVATVRRVAATEARLAPLHEAATDLALRSLAADPAADPSTVADVWTAAGARLLATGRRAEALVAAEQAVARRRLATTPGTWSAWDGLASALLDQVDPLVHAGRLADAEAAVAEALHLYREVTPTATRDPRPDEGEPWYQSPPHWPALTHNAVSGQALLGRSRLGRALLAAYGVYGRLGRADDQIRVVTEAHTLYRADMAVAARSADERLLELSWQDILFRELMRFDLVPPEFFDALRRNIRATFNLPEPE